MRWRLIWWLLLAVGLSSVQSVPLSTRTRDKRALAPKNMEEHRVVLVQGQDRAVHAVVGSEKRLRRTSSVDSVLSSARRRLQTAVEGSREQDAEQLELSPDGRRRSVEVLREQELHAVVRSAGDARIETSLDEEEAEEASAESERTKGNARSELDADGLDMAPLAHEEGNPLLEVITKKEPINEHDLEAAASDPSPAHVESGEEEPDTLLAEGNGDSANNDHGSGYSTESSSAQAGESPDSSNTVISGEKDLTTSDDMRVDGIMTAGIAPDNTSELTESTGQIHDKVAHQSNASNHRVWEIATVEDVPTLCEVFPADHGHLIVVRGERLRNSPELVCRHAVRDDFAFTKLSKAVFLGTDAIQCEVPADLRSDSSVEEIDLEVSNDGVHFSSPISYTRPILLDAEQHRREREQAQTIQNGGQTMPVLESEVCAHGLLETSQGCRYPILFQVLAVLSLTPFAALLFQLVCILRRAALRYVPSGGISRLKVSTT